MDRLEDNLKKSVFDYFKHHKSSKITAMNAVRISEELNFSSEIIKMNDRINQLQSRVSKDSEDIGDIIKELEYCLALGNNDKNINQIFFNSRMFLSIIECLNYTRPKFVGKIVTFIEKMLRGNKYIAKYLSKNLDFVKRIMILMKNDSLFENAIKISEELFMNSSALIPLSKIAKELEENYVIVDKASKIDSFCRILAIMIFDHKKMEFKQIFKYKENLKIKPLAKITAENQSICYHLPKLLKKIKQTLKSKFEKTMNIANELSYSTSFFEQSLNLNESQGSDVIFPMTRPAESQPSSYQSPNDKKKVVYNLFQSLRYNEMLPIIRSNIFVNFIPNWKSPSLHNADNIFNSYMKITKIFKSLKNKSKIKQAHKHYISLIKYSSYQIEMLFVLSTLLGCKRKIEIQDKLARYDIIELLNSYIEYLEWGNIFNENNRPFFDVNEVNYSDDNSYHGRGCNCDSDTALKIQFLRLIYTFCCRDKDNVQNKLMLYSMKDFETFFCSGYLQLFFYFFYKNYLKYKDQQGIKFNSTFSRFYEMAMNDKLKIHTQNEEEMNEIIQNILLSQAKLENLTEFVDFYSNSINDDKIGLLNKLIMKYVQECYYSSAKFWLASCIEVMIRGNNTFFQTQVASSGLVPCLLYDILYSKNDQAQILQLSFDILGELIKFNKGNFLLINYYFVDHNEFQAFTKKIVAKETLVDSNVFLRSIIISIHFFNDVDKALGLDDTNGGYFTQNCKFCLFIKENIHLVFELLTQIVKPTDINQTNISCINTALLILIMEYLHGDIGQFLMTVRSKFSESRISLENFRSLLIMWKEFYSYRPKDSASLQHSTTINFNIWQEVTSKLLINDENNIESLFYKY